MRLYNNDEYREEFMELVYSLLQGDGTNDRANLIIDAFDRAPKVEAVLLPPNDPLTLEELREMDGEPVWVETPGVRKCGRWGIVAGVDIESRSLYLQRDYSCHDYGKTWLAYRRKPEEGTT